MCSVIGMKLPRGGVLGGSYDFYYHHGLVVTNRRGLRKQALAERAPFLEWESRHGSVTFNQFGRELPSCGMNEAGLAIHMAQVVGGAYPPVPEGRPRLNELQWIQYQLDRHATVEEVVAGLDECPIELAYLDLHYALCDRRGGLAVIEFTAGRTRVLRTENGAGLVMTNHPVGDELAESGAAPRAPANTAHSRKRFRILRERLDAWPRGEAPVSPAEAGLPEDPELRCLASGLGAVRRDFSLWQLVRWFVLRVPPAYTCWNTLFDPGAGTFYFRTVRVPAWRRVDCTRLDFAPTAPSLCLDVETRRQGDVTPAFRPVRREDNARIIHTSYKPLGSRFSEQDLEALIDYPDQFPINPAGAHA